jgi:hypothetical protein
MIEAKNPKSSKDEIMTVEEVGLYLKVTPAMVYNLIKKGKTQNKWSFDNILHLNKNAKHFS